MKTAVVRLPGTASTTHAAGRRLIAASTIEFRLVSRYPAFALAVASRYMTSRFIQNSAGMSRAFSNSIPQALRLRCICERTPGPQSSRLRPPPDGEYGTARNQHVRLPRPILVADTSPARESSHPCNVRTGYLA